MLSLIVLLATLASAEEVMTTSTPTIDKSFFPTAIARHAKPKASVIEGLSDPKPDERVGSALLIWSKFPEERSRVLALMSSDKDLDVRRRIATQLAYKYKVQEAIALLEEHFRARFDLQREASADLYISLARKLTELKGRPFGIDGAFTILEAPSDWFADAEIRYPTRGEVRKDGLRTSAASFLADLPEMQGNERLRSALENYAAIVESKIRQTEGPARRNWEGRLWTLLDLETRAGFPDRALHFSDRVSLMKDDYNRKAFEDVMARARKAKVNRKGKL